jgi:hypothetical protein
MKPKSLENIDRPRIPGNEEDGRVYSREKKAAHQVSQGFPRLRTGGKAWRANEERPARRAFFTCSGGGRA